MSAHSPVATGASSQYRAIRVVIHPGRTATLVAVVARTIEGRRSTDRLIHRLVLPHSSVTSATEILLLASAALERAAGETRATPSA